MLLRLITVISLITFMLLMISGLQVDVALYRGLLVFLALFTLIYLAIFFLNIIRDKPGSKRSTVPNYDNTRQSKDD
ncbi:MAG: hypothetical protein WEC12_03940 [Balneolaceae bacterium]